LVRSLPPPFSNPPTTSPPFPCLSCAELTLFLFWRFPGFLEERPGKSASRAGELFPRNTFLWERHPPCVHLWIAPSDPVHWRIAILTGAVSLNNLATSFLFFRLRNPCCADLFCVGRAPHHALSPQNPPLMTRQIFLGLMLLFISTVMWSLQEYPAQPFCAACPSLKTERPSTAVSRVFFSRLLQRFVMLNRVTLSQTFSPFLVFRSNTLSFLGCSGRKLELNWGGLHPPSFSER